MELPLASRLIVAADFKPDSEGAKGVRKKVVALGRSLMGTGVIIKVNSGLRAAGYELIEDLHRYGLKVFADLKLNDISETLKTDGALLAEYKPELLTVMCSTGVESMQGLKAALPRTEVIGVTVLTSLTDFESDMIYGERVKESVFKLAKLALAARIDGLVCSGKELEYLTQFSEQLTFNTPAIRPEWHLDPGDQNPNRVMTPKKALALGATRLVIGRPITQADNPGDAVKRTLDEMSASFA